jgi:hypothetical protein
LAVSCQIVEGRAVCREGEVECIATTPYEAKCRQGEVEVQINKLPDNYTIAVGGEEIYTAKLDTQRALRLFKRVGVSPERLVRAAEAALAKAGELVRVECTLAGTAPLRLKCTAGGAEIEIESGEDGWYMGDQRVGQGLREATYKIAKALGVPAANMRDALERVLGQPSGYERHTFSPIHDYIPSIDPGKPGIPVLGVEYVVSPTGGQTRLGYVIMRDNRPEVRDISMPIIDEAYHVIYVPKRVELDIGGVQATQFRGTARAPRRPSTASSWATSLETSRGC